MGLVDIWKVCGYPLVKRVYPGALIGLNFPRSPSGAEPV